jgi:hypothetical protein
MLTQKIQSKICKKNTTFLWENCFSFLVRNYTLRCGKGGKQIGLQMEEKTIMGWWSLLEMIGNSQGDVEISNAIQVAKTP